MIQLRATICRTFTTCSSTTRFRDTSRMAAQHRRMYFLHDPRDSPWQSKFFCLVWRGTPTARFHIPTKESILHNLFRCNFFPPCVPLPPPPPPPFATPLSPAKRSLFPLLATNHACFFRDSSFLFFFFSFFFFSFLSTLLKNYLSKIPDRSRTLPIHTSPWNLSPVPRSFLPTVLLTGNIAGFGRQSREGEGREGDEEFRKLMIRVLSYELRNEAAISATRE